MDVYAHRGGAVMKLLRLVRDMIGNAIIMLGILVLSTAVLVVFGYMIIGIRYVVGAQ